MLEKVKQLLRYHYKEILFFTCLLEFLALAEDVFFKEIMKGDIIGYAFISKYLMSPFVTPIMKAITFLGNATFLIPLTLIICIVIKNKKISWLIALNLIIITILNQTLKFLLQRPRPIEFQIIQEKGYSFPSGHSMVSMAFYGFLIYLIYHFIKNKTIKVSFITLLGFCIIMVGISRMYLGVHYTSDVIAGFCLSIAYLIVYTSFASSILFPKEKGRRK